MPDNKLTDNEIKKALECCSKNSITGWFTDCEKCPLKDNSKCITELNYKVLDLINRLQAKVDSFEKRQKPTGASGYKIENGKVVFFVDMLGSYSYEYKDLDEVVKTLNELLKECYSKDEIVCALKCKTEELKTAKATAYKECIEKVKEEILFYSNMTEVYEFLDNLLKELVGEDK